MGRPTIITIGSKYGLLTVVRIIPSGKRGKHSKAEVICECGNTSYMTSQILKKSKSCGCKRHDSSTWKRVGAINKPQMLPFGQASKNQMFWSYANSARKRNLEFTLSKEEFVEICESNCFYCNSVPSKQVGLDSYNGKFLCNGVDRMDNTKGYTSDNSVPCCSTCNYAKHKLGTMEFIAHCNRIAQYHANTFPTASEVN